MHFKSVKWFWDVSICNSSDMSLLMICIYIGVLSFSFCGSKESVVNKRLIHIVSRPNAVNAFYIAQLQYWRSHIAARWRSRVIVLCTSVDHNS